MAGDNSWWQRQRGQQGAGRLSSGVTRRQSVEAVAAAEAPMAAGGGVMKTAG